MNGGVTSDGVRELSSCWLLLLGECMSIQMLHYTKILESLHSSYSWGIFKKAPCKDCCTSCILAKSRVSYSLLIIWTPSRKYKVANHQDVIYYSITHTTTMDANPTFFLKTWDLNQSLLWLHSKNNILYTGGVQGYSTCNCRAINDLSTLGALPYRHLHLRWSQ